MVGTRRMKLYYVKINSNDLQEKLMIVFNIRTTIAEDIVDIFVDGWAKRNDSSTDIIVSSCFQSNLFFRFRLIVFNQIPIHIGNVDVQKSYDVSRHGTRNL